MSAPRRATATKKGRVYVHPTSGARLMSVTTVLGKAIAKESLVAWAAKTVATEAVRDLPLVTKMARTDPDAAVAHLKGRPYATRDKAASLGSAVHDWAEKVLHGTANFADIPEDAQPFIRQYLAFLEDYRIDIDHDVEATEATVSNQGDGWAGTGDAWLRVPAFRDGIVLVDNKTSSTRPASSVYPEYALQLAAYRHADELWLPDDTTIAPPETVGAAILNLRPDAYALVPVRADDAVYEAFLGALRIARWLSEDGDDALGQPALPAAAVNVEAVA